MKFETSDKKIIQVNKEIMLHSQYIKGLLADLGEQEDVLSLQEIDSETFNLVIEYLTHHKDTPEMTDEELEEFKLSDKLDPFDEKYFAMDQTSLFSVIRAANFLNCTRLLNCACKAVALLIRGKSTEEIRDVFGIVNDFSPEEEEKIRQENLWCQDL